MLNWLLSFFGYRIIYTALWTNADGTATRKYYDSRYNSLDYRMGRPIHIDMRVAPPNAKMQIVKFNK